MRAAYALMAPTSCRGFSAAMATRSVAPAETGAVEVFMLARSLRPRADSHHGAAGHLALDVRRKRRGQLGEWNRAARDAREVAWRAVAGDPAPHLEPIRARRCRRVDAEQVHAAQDERHDRRLEHRAAREPDACDVPPEIDLADQAREHR